MNEEMQTGDAPQLPPNVTPKGGGELFIFARNPVEMAVAQQAQVAWAERRIELKRKERDQFQENLDIATKNKWRTSTLRSAVQREQRKMEFYEKVRDALKAGYYIVPDMDIDLFAVRTTRKKPKENRESGQTYSWGGGPNVKEEETTSPPSREGAYVSPQQKISETVWSKEAPDGTDKEKTVPMVTRWAEEHGDIDFPFTFAKAEVLEATSEALQQKIFDEVGVLPRTRGQDPMVIGRVTYRVNSYRRKSLNFLIAWFIDTKEL